MASVKKSDWLLHGLFSPSTSNRRSRSLYCNKGILPSSPILPTSLAHVRLQQPSRFCVCYALSIQKELLVIRQYSLTENSSFSQMRKEEKWLEKASPQSVCRHGSQKLSRAKDGRKREDFLLPMKNDANCLCLLSPPHPPSFPVMEYSFSPTVRGGRKSKGDQTFSFTDQVGKVGESHSVNFFLMNQTPETHGPLLQPLV